MDPKHFEIPWPERVLSVAIASPFGAIELHTTHIPPGSSNRLIKVHTLKGIFCRLAIDWNGHRILCGDFNTPKEEAADGKIVTWGKKGSSWDIAEWLVLKGLAKYDLSDVYRLLDGYGMTEFSYYSRTHGRRYDHVFASQSLRPYQCRYLDEWLKANLSDHAPIEVSFQPTAALGLQC